MDASALVEAFLDNGVARARLRDDELHAPHLVDPEVAQALRRLVLRGRIEASEGRRALVDLDDLGLTRHPMTGFLPRLWELRASVSAYDACYVALAEGLDCPLVTADGRLARAPGILCPVTVVPV